MRFIKIRSSEIQVQRCWLKLSAVFTALKSLSCHNYFHLIFLNPHVSQSGANPGKVFPSLWSRLILSFSFLGGEGVARRERKRDRLWQLLGGRVSHACLFPSVSLFFCLDYFSYVLATLIPNRGNTTFQDLFQLYLSLIWDFFFSYGGKNVFS